MSVSTILLPPVSFPNLGHNLLIDHNRFDWPKTRKWQDKLWNREVNLRGAAILDSCVYEACGYFLKFTNYPVCLFSSESKPLLACVCTHMW